jgi:hypothetical protein
MEFHQLSPFPASRKFFYSATDNADADYPTTALHLTFQSSTRYIKEQKSLHTTEQSKI